ncbi:MAG TPA: transposase [Gemmataceae bacterium]|nr:transposase [Gemmataceae bacterium]
MGQSLGQIYLHVVFSTKHREAFFADLPFRERAHAYLAGACRNLESPSIIVGGVADHVHLLCRLSKNLAPATLVRELKRESSKWVKAEVAGLSAFAWQNGYGAFSVSPGHVQILKEYIAKQEEHHRRQSFQDELRRLLQKYAIEYDERYVWD